jgi:hypothetical protein
MEALGVIKARERAGTKFYIVDSRKPRAMPRVTSSKDPRAEDNLLNPDDVLVQVDRDGRRTIVNLGSSARTIDTSVMPIPPAPMTRREVKVYELDFDYSLSTMLEKRLSQPPPAKSQQKIAEQRAKAISDDELNYWQSKGIYDRQYGLTAKQKEDLHLAKQAEINAEYDAEAVQLKFDYSDSVEQEGLKGMGERTSKQLEAGADLIRNPGRMGAQAANTWLKYLPVPEIVQWFKDRIPGLTQWYERQQAYSGTRNGILDAFAVAVKPLRKGKTAAQFNDTAGLTTFHQVDPAKTLAQQDWVKDYGSLAEAERQWEEQGWKGTTGMTFERGYQKTKDAYKRMGKEAREAFHDVAHRLQRVREQEQKALIEKVYEITEADSPARERMLKEARSMYKSLRGIYFPLGRFGDYRVIATDTFLPGPDGEGQFVLESFESLAARDQRIAEMKANARYTDVRASYASSDPATRTTSQDFLRKMQLEGSQIERDFVARELRRARALKGDELTDVEVARAESYAKKQTEDVVDMLAGIWMDSLPETSALKNAVKRGNIPGWDQNMVRASSDYMTRHAGNLASLEHG